MDFLPPDKHAPIPDDILRILEKSVISIEDRHACLSKALLETGIASDELIKMNKDLCKLDYSVDMFKALKAKEKEVIGLKELVKESVEDEEMRRLASGELQTATREVRDAQDEVLLERIPKDEADSRGAGGDEASIFASDLFKKYEKYAQTTHGGLKFSALPPPTPEVDVDIRNDEIKIDTYRAGGAMLYELERSRTAASRSELQQDQIGSSDRLERIRTCNFPQDRVTDHRVGVTQHSIEQIMEGIDVDNWKHLFERQESHEADGRRSSTRGVMVKRSSNSSNKHRISWTEVVHRNLEDSQASSSNFSFMEDLGHGKGKKILSPHPGAQRSDAMKEFLGYYMLLNCPVFRAMVQRFFSQFCVEFCKDEELLAVSLFIPEMQDFPSFGNSPERELECLPPSPC
ncbi:hypothetical protein SELMODRAFT_412495 [Selaginella moellendorffii]|uniref:Peptide chain release factor domain-containing protein n=1 Tax=Selaginella moellendorffii TaxID=88036 RepID=D8RLN4_SELML|nr:hypothetical protein SELMODRAFT_412495 [Selaginella moellendorffii]